MNEDGKATGTVTTRAKKETDRVMAFVLPFVRDYAALATKGSAYRQVDGGYPHILLGIPGKSGDITEAVIDPKTDEYATPEPETNVESIIAQLNSLPPEMLDSIDVNATLIEIQKLEAENKANAQEFWMLMDSAATAIETTTDEQISEKLNESKGSRSWYSYETTRIDAFDSDAMRYTRWNGWCGPSAIAWIYRGLYSSYYKGTYLPLYSEASFKKTGYRKWDEEYLWSGYYIFNTENNQDSDGDNIWDDCDRDWVEAQSAKADGGLYARIAELSGMYNWQWFSPNEGNIIGIDGGMNAALRNVTNGYYGFSGVHLFGSADYIRLEHLPVLISTGDHILTAFGSRIEWYNWEVYCKIFGWTVFSSRGKITTCTWVYVHDNGRETRKFHFGPYMRCQDFSEYDINFRVIH